MPSIRHVAVQAWRRLASLFCRHRKQRHRRTQSIAKTTPPPTPRTTPRRRCSPRAAEAARSAAEAARNAAEAARGAPSVRADEAARGVASARSAASARNAASAQVVRMLSKLSQKGILGGCGLHDMRQPELSPPRKTDLRGLHHEGRLALEPAFVLVLHSCMVQGGDRTRSLE